MGDARSRWSRQAARRLSELWQSGQLRVAEAGRERAELTSRRSAGPVATGSAPPVVAANADPVSHVPYGLRVAAALSWRLLVVLGAVTVLGWVLARLSLVVIPVAIALLLTAMLLPAVDFLDRRGVPRGLATAVVLVTGLAAVGGVLTFVIRAFIDGVPDLQEKILDSIYKIRNWLVTGPLRVQESELDDAVESLGETISRNSERITSGAFSVALDIGNFLTGVVLALFTLIFFLYDGRRVWGYLVRMLPAEARERVDLAGRTGFSTLVAYVRASVIVAVVDAVGIGIGLWAVGAPLVLPLAALVFLGAFVPIVGAVVTGVVAVLVVLVANGPIEAVIILAVVLAVQQLEGNVLQPLMMGRAVKLHALAVVIAVSVGVVVSGIVGALLAVPLVALLNSGIGALRGQRSTRTEEQVADVEGPPPAPPPPEAGRQEPPPAVTQPE